MPIASRAAASSAGLLLATSLLPLVAIFFSGVGSARAAEPIAFTIPAEDGYGIAECLSPGNACGAAIASSWCEAHGHSKAIAFGAADVTASTAAGGTGPIEPGAMMIRCGD